MTDIADLTDFAKWSEETKQWVVDGLSITREQYTDKEGKLKKVLQLNGGRMSFKFQGRLIQKPDKYVPPGKSRVEIMSDPKSRFSCFVAIEYWKDSKKYEADPDRTAAAHVVAKFFNDRLIELHPELPPSQLNTPFNVHGDGVTISMKKSDQMKLLKIIGYRVVSDTKTGKPLYETAVVDTNDFDALDKDDCCTWATETSAQTTNTITDDKTGEVTMSTQYAPYCSCSIRERRKPAQAVKTAGSRDLEDASAAAEAEAAAGTTSSFLPLDDDGNVVGEFGNTEESKAGGGESAPALSLAIPPIPSAAAPSAAAPDVSAKGSSAAPSTAAQKVAPKMTLGSILEDEPEESRDASTKTKRTRSTVADEEDGDSSGARSRRRAVA